MTNDSIEILLTRLGKRLENGDPNVVTEAVFQIGNLERDAGPMTPLLIGLCQSPIEKVRIAAATAVGRVHSIPDKSIPALMGLLHDDSLDVQRHAAASLCLFDYEELSAHDIESHLAFIYMNNEDEHIRSFIGSLLVRLGDKTNVLSVS